MAMFKASFVVGATTVFFGALAPDHTDKVGPVREFSCGTHFLLEADWTNFRSLVCWDAQVVPMPWGNTVEILVKGGPGPGTLNIPGFTGFGYTAYLVEATRSNIFVSGQSKGTARFLITNPLP